MKKNVIVLIAVSGVLFLAALGYWRMSPSFAIWELKTALKKKDLALLYSRLDLESLYVSGLDAVQTKSRREAQVPVNMWDKVASSIGRGVDRLTSAQSIDLIKHELELELQRDRNIPAPLSQPTSQPLISLLFHDVTEIELDDPVKRGERAYVNASLKLRKMQKSYPLTLKLSRDADSEWRVSAFEGLSSVLETYETDRNARVDHFNQSLQKDLESQLPFFGETRSESTDGGLSSILNIDLVFQNRTDKRIRLIRGRVEDRSKPPLISRNFESGPMALAPGEKKVFLEKQSEFLSPANPRTHGLSLQFIYSEVQFEDGKVLKPVHTFEEL